MSKDREAFAAWYELHGNGHSFAPQWDAWQAALSHAAAQPSDLKDDWFVDAALKFADEWTEYNRSDVDWCVVHNAFIDGVKAALSHAAAQQSAEPVASVTECEACLTPDACRLRGKCDHYAAERLRITPPAQPSAEPDATKVICAQCCHQFRAIPIQVQRLMLAAGFEPPFTAAPAQPSDQEARELLRKTRNILEHVSPSPGWVPDFDDSCAAIDTYLAKEV